MCGLVGAFSWGEKRIDADLLARMRDTMAHRGPNGAGLWMSKDGRVGLAHRRLSIVDLSDAASQPMSLPNESLQIVFNGEIYNHAEIRAELKSLGVGPWKTDHSDTEVILYAFRQWGPDCVHRFRGMFAFALWDASNEKLHLVRDRIGVKPLYYAINGTKISFTSEIKALLLDPSQTRRLNEAALYHFLTFMTSPAPDTMFDGIKKLPPATWLTVDKTGSFTERKYWDVLDQSRGVTESDQDMARRVLDELRTSVRLRKVSDVPVGVFLSGGIDSSTNAVLFSEGEKEPVRTFSIGYDGNYGSNPDELGYARAIAEKVGARHMERRLSVNDLLDFLPAMVRHQDEPIADPVCVPVFYVSKLARDNGVIVCQVGEGADELFCGYPNWLRLQRLENWNRSMPGFVKSFGLALLAGVGKDQTRPYERLRRGSEGQPVFWGGTEAFSETEKKRLLSPRLKQRFRNYSSFEVLEPIYRRFQDKAWEKSPLHWMTYLDLNMRLPELLLMRVDKMSMATGLEGRVPFLDHKFVELAMSIPEEAQIRGGNLKNILKLAVRDVIPDSVINRPKQGFGVPVKEWFWQHLGEKAEADIKQFNRETDLFDVPALDRLLATRDSERLWPLLNLALWHREFFRAV